MTVADESEPEPSRSLTAAGEILGTPAYMPPEQARGDVSSLDRRSDVFALGAVLFEILTHRRLHEGCSLTESLRRSACGDFAASLECLHDDKIPDDLRSLCLRCLSSDPGGRPDDASEVAETIADHLASVERRARQAELHEQEAKVRAAEEVKRRRVQTLTAFAIAAVAIVGAAAVMWQWNSAVEADVKKGEALELADERLVLANERLLQAQAVVDDYLTEIAKDDGVLMRTPGAQELRRSLLEKARDYYIAFLEQAPDDAAVLEGAARASGRLGEVYFLLDPAGEEFYACYNKAIELYERLCATDPANPDYLVGIAKALGEKGRSYTIVEDRSEALRYYQEARAMWKEIMSIRGEPEDQFGLAMMTHNVGDTLSHLGKLDEAEASLLEALDLATPVLESTPDDPERLMQTCRMHNSAGTHFGFRRGKWQRCYELYKASSDLAERLVQVQPQRHRSLQERARQSMNLGLALYQLKRFDESEQAFVSALRTNEMLVRENPTVTEYRESAARNCTNLATFMFKRQRFEESAEYSARAAETYFQLARDNPAIVRYQDEAGSAPYSLASTIPDSPRAAEAIRQLAAVSGQLAENVPDESHIFRANQAYWLGLLCDATADELLSLTEAFAADTAWHTKSKSQAFGGRVLALIRSGRHREALELLESVQWKDEVVTCLLLECMARFPTDPHAAAKIYKQAEKKIGPANSRDYDVVVLRREAKELLKGNKPTGPAS